MFKTYYLYLKNGTKRDYVGEILTEENLNLNEFMFENNTYQGLSAHFSTERPDEFWVLVEKINNLGEHYAYGFLG